MFQKHRHSAWYSWIQLFVWITILFNGVINRHYHYDLDGRIVSHAHPISQNDSDHTHSEEELLWLDLISNPIFLLDNCSPSIPTVATTEAPSLFFEKTYTADYQRSRFTFGLKAPPLA